MTNNSPKKHLFAVYCLGFSQEVASKNPQFVEAESEGEIRQEYREELGSLGSGYNFRIYKIGTKIFDSKYDL